MENTKTKKLYILVAFLLANFANLANSAFSFCNIQTNAQNRAEQFLKNNKSQVGQNNSAILDHIGDFTLTNHQSRSDTPLTPKTGTTRFVSNVKVKDIKTGKIYQGTVDIKPTLDRIKAGTKFPHKNDGSIFKNNEKLLPTKPQGYYKEYVHPTPNITGPGPQRIVKGANGELFYTPDHYGTFIPLNP